MLKLDPDRAATAPKDAATLLVLREGSDGVEVFCVRRHAKSAFMGGVVVFPGGKLDAEDGSPTMRDHTDGLHQRSTSISDDEGHALALTVCACRESLEEAAILPAVPAPDAAASLSLRKVLEERGDFGALLAREGLTLQTRALVPFARWLTPVAEQRRFDARFYLTALPNGQAGLHDDRETTSSVWATPRKMLDAYQAGQLFLAPPTIRAFEVLIDVASIEAALALASEQSLLPICPELVSTDPPTLALPGDPEHSVEATRVAGPTRFVLRDGKFVSEDA